MLRDQAHNFFLGFLLFNAFCRSFTIDREGDTNIQIPSFVTSIEPIDLDSIILGQNVTLVCRTNVTDSKLWWTFNGDNITDDISYITDQPDDDPTTNIIVSYLHIINITFSQQGNFSCNAFNENDNIYFIDTVTVTINYPTAVVSHSPRTKVKLHDEVTLYCLFKGYPLSNVTWHKNDSTESLSNYTTITPLNESLKNVSLYLRDVNKKHNGNYSCISNNDDVSERIELLILDKPQITVDFIKALGTNIIYLNWTVNDGNDPEHLSFRIQYMENGGTNWVYYPEKISGPITHKVLDNMVFKPNTTYSIQMEASNTMGDGQKSQVKTVTTLSSNPEFIPEVKVTGVTVSSITISWSQLPQELQDHVHYYQLLLKTENRTEKAIHSTPGDHFYMFKDLSAATTYEFQVAACSEYLKKCSPWSNVANGTTLDGISDPPTNVNLSCQYNNISHTSSVLVSWKPPENPNGKIMHYNVVLEGGAIFINENGVYQNISWGPKMTTANEKSLMAKFYNISANTNYTVKISAVTRSKKHGQHVVTQCTVPSTTPDKNSLLRYTWNKVEEQGKWLFKLFLPRISERNGAICCYRIYLIKMEPHKTIADLPSPEDLVISSYDEVHSNPKGGVYMAEMFSSEYFQSEVFLGDDQILKYNDSSCLVCTGHLYSAKPKIQSLLQNSSVPKLSVSTPIPSESVVLDITDNQVFNEPTVETTTNKLIILPTFDTSEPYDGVLDMNSNYTGFIEIIVHGSDKGETIPAYSNYFNILTPGPTVFEAPSYQVIGIVVQILCALVLIVVVLLMALCLLHRYTKQVAHVQGVEMITFRNSFSTDK